MVTYIEQTNSMSSVGFKAWYGIISIVLIISAICAVVSIIGLWKMFKAAGKDGWRAIIPLLNTYTASQIAFGDDLGWTGFLILAGCIPVVGGIVSAAVSLYLNFKFAKSFGKSDGESVAYMFFAPILMIIWLMRHDYQYFGSQYSIYHKFFNKGNVQ